MGYKKRISGLVEKIEDSFYTINHRRYPSSALYIKSNPRAIVEFPRKFSQQEKNIILGQQASYTKTRDRFCFVSEYKLEILDAPYKNWKITVNL